MCLFFSDEAGNGKKKAWLDKINALIEIIKKVIS